MRELEWPFDAENIVKRKKWLKKQLLMESVNHVKKKVAVLGGSTTNDIVLILELFLLNYGIEPEFYECEYNQYYEEGAFDNPVLKAFAPDIVFVHTSNRNICEFPNMNDSRQDIEERLSREYSRYVHLWENLKEQYHCEIIQNNFEAPFYRLFGNKDTSDIHGKCYYITRLNLLFAEYAQEHSHFWINDINYLSAQYGLETWSDPFYWYMYKYALNVAAIPYLSFSVANIIKSIYGKNKKGLVLDLDNTLWGGVIGDDGVEHISIGQENAESQAYYEFQSYLKSLKEIGVLLNVNSKNDEENALNGLKHPESCLNPEDFIVIKANWEPKDRNLVAIARELNVAEDSLVFVDDNPAEREIVRQSIPGVISPELDKVEHYIQAVDRNGFFEVTNLSRDDRDRNQMYRENAERAKLQTSFTDYSKYLESLEMRAYIRNFEPIYYERIAQLTNKSNQFNLTTKRYSTAEIEQAALDSDNITLYGRLDDRFGSNGIVSVVIGRLEEDVCHIGLWLMSCRVLKRDMEYAMMDTLVKLCAERGVREVRGYYYPTAKNKMVEDFYLKQGFSMVEKDEQGNTVWSMELESYEKKNKVIKVVDTDE